MVLLYNPGGAGIYKIDADMSAEKIFSLLEGYRIVLIYRLIYLKKIKPLLLILMVKQYL